MYVVQCTYDIYVYIRIYIRIYTCVYTHDYRVTRLTNLAYEMECILTYKLINNIQTDLYVVYTI